MWEKLTPGQRKFVNKRVQKYSKQTQYYAHTFNPKQGHGLPFCVKFPKILEYFKIIDRKHPWANHHQGIYNGMFFIPAEPDQTSFKIPEVFGGIINEGFRDSPEYKLLLHLKSSIKNSCKITDCYIGKRGTRLRHGFPFSGSRYIFQ